jgi:nucleoside-diphosphate kinase
VIDAAQSYLIFDMLIDPFFYSTTGADVVKVGRAMLGATLPSESAPGTIRGDLCIEVGRNICHGSDSVESANKEIAHWFPEGICEWTSCQEKWIYE